MKHSFLHQTKQCIFFIQFSEPVYWNVFKEVLVPHTQTLKIKNEWILQPDIVSSLLTASHLVLAPCQTLCFVFFQTKTRLWWGGLREWKNLDLPAGVVTCLRDESVVFVTSAKWVLAYFSWKWSKQKKKKASCCFWGDRFPRETHTIIWKHLCHNFKWELLWTLWICSPQII